MEVLEQDLTCSMCFELFKNPKALPCVHTFCLECLKRYVNSQASVIAQHGQFNCPLCRVGTRPPEPVSHNISLWADGFKNNHLVSSMIESLKAHKSNHKDNPSSSTLQSDVNPSSDDCIRNGRVGPRGGTAPLFCSVCRVMVGGRWCEQCCQHLCGPCEKIHSQNDETSVHVVVDNPNAYSSDSPEGAAEKNQVDNLPCAKHPGEFESFYCAKCNQACCGLCVSSDHSSCFRVLPLQQAIQNKVQLGQVYTSIIGLQKDNLKHMQGLVTSKRQENQTNHERLCHEILSIRPMVDKILAEDEKRLLDELKVKTTRSVTELNEMEMACRRSIFLLTDKGEVLQNALDMNTVQRLHFLSIWDDISEFMKKNSSQHQDFKIQLENLHTSGVSFEPSNLVRSVLKGAHSSLGSLVGRGSSAETPNAFVSEETPSARNLETPAPSPAQLKLKSSRNLKLDSEIPPLLTGICLLPGDVVVMCDFSNNKLKMVDQQRQLKYCILPTSPYGITYNPDNNQLIVSLPSSKELAFISPKLKIERHVKVLKEYTAVTFNKVERTLVCTSSNPASIDVLCDDVVIRTLGLANARRPLFGEPEYLSLHSNQNILVSDWDKKALFYVDSKGNVISTFTGELGVNELRCPLGIAIDPNGLIYLADKEGSKVYRFSADFKFESIILTQSDQIKQPIAMAFDSRGHLFVTESSGYLKLFG